ncbi:DUF1616 domain-containing protein [Halorubrum ezzemoulense]|uniref:DUF1616 domain-containing protein n=1 Tax=Halorubrum ezzemoulense TaxID=337243 RepID=UPI001FE6C9A6|nr:DUF1616 domain-containing protein [Halorubrum ezzemoulense]
MRCSFSGLYHELSASSPRSSLGVFALSADKEINRFQATIEHNSTHHEPHTLQPTQTGENLRVKYLLCKGGAPEKPIQENSYWDLHIWIDLVGPSQSVNTQGF